MSRVFSRVTEIVLELESVDVQTAVDRYRQETLPALRAQDGYLGLLVLATPDGRGLVITLWETEATATAGTDGEGFYSDVVRHYMPMLRHATRHEHYEVVLTDGRALPLGEHR